nr:MAG TPA: Protein of unknown function (DUF3276) [Caudoviricetes sp.]
MNSARATPRRYFFDLSQSLNNQNIVRIAQ